MYPLHYIMGKITHAVMNQLCELLMRHFEKFVNDYLQYWWFFLENGICANFWRIIEESLTGTDGCQDKFR